MVLSSRPIYLVLSHDKSVEEGGKSKAFGSGSQNMRHFTDTHIDLLFNIDTASCDVGHV